MDKTLTEFFLPDLSRTHQWGQQLAQRLPVGTIVLLKGNLGAGKTSLVQGIGRGLGIQGEIVSPTFTIVNEYREGKIPLYHLDLYRLNPLEVEYLYPEQYWQGEDFPLGIAAVEWPERLPELPSQYLQIELSLQREGRAVRITTEGWEMDLKTLLPAS
ncbi:MULTISPECIES: tRNA (adenosine(37)-N6)-threonylcarbamoyltransferase complex ATPase subunit type 1 TsaE [unclassified Synechocystis]|uniref:tRNA (adenosine(37)-N6)-threonylcarbamoyltransferase complex ATPase subunit type 1 TsaE n=1 Tax=unclassified Synechocystis TaxID=2640012 RepID=UPI0003FC0FA8|nr:MULTISPECIES: tRNA (adenosine(37)-N6)-threonylcarbamoyltransferase complex ATPase subunit type 1 TsaE [unclassified Synechocystis]AIE75577.1 ATPase YjeE, predicted to have essential role in cell wall biosynthesis [Synechocystis sp. PCC 6714]MCT0253778.1 tRNA (adenosine(37)-N6)-threonylcarbamoyltransferase complex ATPase subunit type 1 TsaE [Synechocystis sp. CS-94]